MVDKIVIKSCRKEAVIVFTDRKPISISSDKDVGIILMWLLDSRQAHLVTNGDTVTGIELRRSCTDEDTIKIDVGEVA